MRVESETRKREQKEIRRDKVKEMLVNESVVSIISDIVPVNIQMRALWLVADCFILSP